MGTKQVKVSELILDWNLWPRHEANGLDSTNVRRMREALKAGVTLPPVIINTDMRVVDGFHRTRAYTEELGDDAKIRVDMRVYESDADMFKDSISFNSVHGLPMSPRDRAHAILKARKFKIPKSAIAMALGMSESSMKTFLERKTAISPTGEVISLPNGARSLAGKTLTEEQYHFANHTSGTIPAMHAAMLINALKADAFALNDNSRAKLIELRDLIDEVLI